MGRITNTSAITSLKAQYSVTQCNFDFCMHYDESRRRCALRRCVYDSNSGVRRNTAKRKSRQEIEEASKWHG
jgi:putative ribosome biogenesis GTPase RsgA